MIQKIMIQIKSPKPLDSYGDGHVLSYDKSSGCYFIETRDSFLQPQNMKIQTLEKRIESLEASLNDALLKTRGKFNELVQKHDEDYNEFLKTYKESNAKIIEMVKSLVEVEDK